MTVGSSILSCCCDAPIAWPACANPHPAAESSQEYTLNFDISVVYMDRFRPANPSDIYDDEVAIYQPDRVPPGCTSQGSPCPFTREYTPADYSFSAKLTHRANLCPDSDGTCRSLRHQVGVGVGAPGFSTVPGSSVNYVLGGSITQGNPCPGGSGGFIPTNTGLPTAESLINVNNASFPHPSYRISWGCNQASTIGGASFFIVGSNVAHPGFGFYGPRMEIVMIEVGRMGTQTGCNQQGDPITAGIDMPHSAPTCFSSLVNCCQYGKSTIVTYWRPLTGDPNAPGFCFTPGVFNLHSVFSPFRCFIVPPAGVTTFSGKTCTGNAPSGDPRRFYISSGFTQCGTWNQPGQPNRIRGNWGLMRWSPALGEPKPDVLNVVVPSSIEIG